MKCAPVCRRCRADLLFIGKGSKFSSHTKCNCTCFMRRDDIIHRKSFTIHYFEMANGNWIKGVSCNNEVHLNNT